MATIVCVTAASQTYTLDFNLTEAQVLELFSGPAFLPWNRMVRLNSRIHRCFQYLGQYPRLGRPAAVDVY